jgi:hypothetical protein
LPIPKVEFEVRRHYWADANHRQTRESGPADVQLTIDSRRYDDGLLLRIEIKPSMGDDYPAVLRQMKVNMCDLLYLVEYTGTGVSLEQVKQMFAASGITVFLHRDFAHLCQPQKEQEKPL